MFKYAAAEWKGEHGKKRRINIQKRDKNLFMTRLSSRECISLDKARHQYEDFVNGVF